MRKEMNHWRKGLQLTISIVTEHELTSRVAA